MITAIKIIQRSLSRLYKIMILLLFHILAYWKKLIILYFLILTQTVKIFLPPLKKPIVIKNCFNSTSELISSTAESSDEFMSRELLVDKLEQPCTVFCTCKNGKYNINTSQQSTDSVQNLHSDLSKVSDLPLSQKESALEKTVTSTVSCFNSKLEFPSPCSDKSAIDTNDLKLNSGKSITDSNLNTANESLCGVDAVSTCNRYDVATYRSKTPFISDIEKKDLTKNVFVPDDNFSFLETNKVSSLNGSSGSLGCVIHLVKMQFV